MSARLEAPGLPANRGSRSQALPVYAGRGMPRLIRSDWPARKDMTEGSPLSVGESRGGVASVPSLDTNGPSPISGQPFSGGQRHHS